MGARGVAPTGSIFIDTRGAGRALRVTWHEDDGLVVLSMWRGSICTGTFRMPVEEVPELIDLLRRGLDGAWRPAPVPVPQPRISEVPTQAEAA